MGSVGRQNWEIIPEGVLPRNCPAKGNRGSFLFSLVAPGSVLPSTSVTRKGHQDFSKWKNPIFTSAALKSQCEGGNLGSQQSIPGFFQVAKLNGATSAAPDPPWLSLAQQSLPSEPRIQNPLLMVLKATTESGKGCSILIMQNLRSVHPHAVGCFLSWHLV